MSSALYTMTTGRCPQCHEGKLFSGVFAIHDKCPACGAVFYRDAGSWTGATVVSYMLGSAFALVVLVVSWATGFLQQKGSEWVVSTSVIVFMLLTYRITKGFWVGLLDDWGQIYPDKPKAPPTEPS